MCITPIERTASGLRPSGGGWHSTLIVGHFYVNINTLIASIVVSRNSSAAPQAGHSAADDKSCATFPQGEQVLDHRAAHGGGQ